MRSFLNPERFYLLQQIFDGVWAELQARGNGAIDNEGETRSKLASMVIDLAHAPELNAELAKQEILQKLPGSSRPVSDALFD
jgi:hypothetical protein